jgi:hypothetical protein
LDFPKIISIEENSTRKRMSESYFPFVFSIELSRTRALSFLNIISENSSTATTRAKHILVLCESFPKSVVIEISSNGLKKKNIYKTQYLTGEKKKI